MVGITRSTWVNALNSISAQALFWALSTCTFIRQSQTLSAYTFIRRNRFNHIKAKGQGRGFHFPRWANPDRFAKLILLDLCSEASLGPMDKSRQSFSKPFCWTCFGAGLFPPRPNSNIFSLKSAGLCVKTCALKAYGLRFHGSEIQQATSIKFKPLVGEFCFPLSAIHPPGLAFIGLKKSPAMDEVESYRVAGCLHRCAWTKQFVWVMLCHCGGFMGDAWQK